jgi:radical SAM protein with 4Fe4S-binding SPASM domain
MEQNRPFKYRKDDPRDDEFYDKVFTLCAQNGYGFHPMVYSNGIEKWIDNFLWFQEMFKKYNINPFRLYLLEVRNAEWTAGQVKEFQKFYDFLIKWTFTELFYSDKQLFVNKAVNGHCGFNMIPSVVSIVGRGLGCSIQSSVYLRLGDLKIFPCHRTFYKQFQTAQFKTDNDGNIIDIDGINPELMVAVYSFESNVAPYCEGCINKYFCAKGCLGSQFETTGDLFTPIPNVCQLEFGRTFQFVKTMKEIGVLDLIKNRLRNNLLIAMNIFEDLIDNKTTSEGGNL